MVQKKLWNLRRYFKLEDGSGERHVREAAWGDVKENLTGMKTERLMTKWEMDSIIQKLQAEMFAPTSLIHHISSKLLPSNSHSSQDKEIA